MNKSNSIFQMCISIDDNDVNPALKMQVVLMRREADCARLQTVVQHLATSTGTSFCIRKRAIDRGQLRPWSFDKYCDLLASAWHIAPECMKEAVAASKKAAPAQKRDHEHVVAPDFEEAGPCAHACKRPKFRQTNYQEEIDD